MGKYGSSLRWSLIGALAVVACYSKPSLLGDPCESDEDCFGLVCAPDGQGGKSCEDLGGTGDGADGTGGADGDTGGGQEANCGDGTVDSGDLCFHPAIARLGSAPLGIAVGDIDGDGIVDLLVSDYIYMQAAGFEVSIFRGQDGGASLGTREAVNVPFDAFDVALADVDGDGNLDLAVAHNEAAKVSVALAQSPGTFAGFDSYDVGAAPVALVAGTFNGDDLDDLAVANQMGRSVGVLLSSGTAMTYSEYPLEKSGDAGQATGLALGDLDSNGDVDIVAASTSPTPGLEGVAILMGAGDGTFGAPEIIDTKLDQRWCAIGDFDGDGKPDIAAAPGLKILTGDGAGEVVSISDVANPANGVETADMDNDGTLDLIVWDYSAGSTVEVLSGNGLGGFAQAQPILDGLVNIGEVQVVDFNDDGALDLVATDSTQVYLLLSDP